MELKELIKILKSHANNQLNKGGWSIALELSEKDQNHVVLKLKDRYLGYLQNFTGKRDLNEFFIEIPSFLEIYEKQKEIESAIKDEKLNKNVDSYIVYNYKNRLAQEIAHIFIENHVLLDICGTAQYNNYSYVKSIHIRDFFSIKNINLKDIKGAKAVYFLGENGDGKSLILMAIHIAFNGNYIKEQTNLEFTGALQQMLKKLSDAKLYGKDVDGTEYSLSNKGVENRYYFLRSFFVYGAQRGRYTKDFPEPYGFMSLYDRDTQLYSPEQLLSQIFLLELEKRLQTQNMIGEDSISRKWVPLKTIQNLFQKLLENNVTIEVTGKSITFTERGYKLSFNQLSEGYKNIMVWVSDLIYHLQEDQQEVDKLENFKGIVLVDEIELHLHPLWQERIVEQLRKFFPNIQFIFTTHSPAIIQGASEDAIIYRVFRNAETGETQVSDPYYKKDLDHLMFNTLVTSPLFGLENARISKNVSSPDTSDSFLQSRVSKRIEEELKRQKEERKEFLSDSDVDALIDKILVQELKK